MRKKNSAQKNSLPKQADNRKHQQKISGKKYSADKQKQWLMLAILAIVTFIVFFLP